MIGSVKQKHIKASSLGREFSKASLEKKFVEFEKRETTKPLSTPKRKISKCENLESVCLSNEKIFWFRDGEVVPGRKRHPAAPFFLLLVEEILTIVVCYLVVDISN
ncbi:hypothetical protein [Desulfotalea psychrophila]|uniref:hypothetical protein n=1 Tax=Desulfotalea psychrophila TaxID=84980 RepID=UPI00059B6B66|nr:hypothetical protein [Desulfotalea psychrophila]